MGRIDDTVRRISELPTRQREYVLKKLGVDGDLTDRERVFVAEYITTMDRAKAAAAAGHVNHPASNGSKMLDCGTVVDAVDRMLAEVEAGCALKAEYVREYIHSVLELCPTDFFSVGPDGDWYIDPDTLRATPQALKRLIDSVELKYVQGRACLKINFISKTAALAMAAKYTLTQKVDATVHVFPWERILESLEKRADDPIEARLLEIDRALAAPGPAVAG